ncbi:uncharacterized protein MONBRDRAFT_32809 [Monosiga brevicollis MX1]|uniref:SARAH domain-containing protein n=1 Tax=Monosiga brevicollis TaxID=81824 RepID=A9V1U5_MONBE|nr:uncharacterized protein MONBRDRAFT_32809 [Monosiga brevicollis MX1]EDQ88624.1 predicted protein [Monosiga brevicollis MX1]|eukprot:XP_001746728.1 hypothetical protein [Monosiga brevicollis MX1]
MTMTSRLDPILRELDEIEALLAESFEPQHTPAWYRDAQSDGMRQQLLSKLDRLETQVESDFNEDRDAVDDLLQALGQLRQEALLEEAYVRELREAEAESNIDAETRSRAVRWLNRNLRRLLSAIKGRGHEDAQGRPVISMRELLQDDIAHGFESIEGIVETAVQRGLLREAFSEDLEPYFIVVGAPPRDDDATNCSSTALFFQFATCVKLSRLRLLLALTQSHKLVASFGSVDTRMLRMSVIQPQGTADGSGQSTGGKQSPALSSPSMSAEVVPDIDVTTADGNAPAPVVHNSGAHTLSADDLKLLLRPQTQARRRSHSMRHRSATFNMRESLSSVTQDTLSKYCSLVWGEALPEAPSVEGSPANGTAARSQDKVEGNGSNGISADAVGTASMNVAGRHRKTPHELLEEQFRKRPELNVDWSKFAVPELENFLRVLEAEEKLHQEQVVNLYRAKRAKLQRKIDLLLKQSVTADAGSGEATDVTKSASNVPHVAAAASVVPGPIAADLHHTLERHDSEAGTVESSRIRLRREQPAKSDDRSKFQRSRSARATAVASQLDQNVGSEGFVGRRRAVTDQRDSLRNRSQVISVYRRRSQAVDAANVKPRQAVTLLLDSVDEDGEDSAGSAPVLAEEQTSSPNVTVRKNRMRKQHKSLFVDDVVDPLNIEEQTGINKELASLAASWIDSELRQVMQVLLDSDSRDEQGRPCITMAELRRSGVTTMVESLGGCLHIGKERGVFAFDGALDSHTPDDTLVTLLQATLPSKPYKVRDLHLSTRRRVRQIDAHSHISVV